jgi:O-antigen/teichoic acid export membrane protein
MSSKSNYLYLLVSVLVSALGLGRNFIFMGYLDLASIGQIAFMQTIVMLVGFVQLGLINGGYRIYASDKPDKSKVNDVIVIYLSGLFCVATLALLFLKSDWNYLDVEFEVALIGVIAGFFTLFSNWFSNMLIANQKLIMSSLINLSAALVSFSLVYVSIEQDLYILLMALAIQPILILMAALLLNPNLRVRTLNFDIDIFKQTFILGVIPFVVGLFLLLIYQVERWTIVWALGADNLGRYYLVIMYTSIFTLLPASLLNLYYPRLIRAYEGREKSIFRSVLRRYLVELLLYLIIVIVITLTVMPMIIDMFLPKYSSIQDLVLISLPGLMFLALSDVASLLFLTVNRLKNIFNAGIIMLITYLLLLSVFVLMDLLTLQSAAYIRSAALVVGFLALSAQLVVVSRSSTYRWLRK